MSRRIVKTKECDCKPLMVKLILPVTDIPLIGNITDKKVSGKYFASLKLNNEQGNSK